ncbi:hypothetical protein ACKAV7_011797 [Fusarium commune]
MRASLKQSHGLLAGLTIAIRLVDAAELAMFPQGSLAGSGLPSTCEATLYQVARDDPAVTKLVCSKACGGSIAHMRLKVASACGFQEMISDVIAAFPEYRMMQADAYTGVYDENVQSSAFNVTNPDVEENTCVSGKTYIAKDGDSCDSIALAQGVSAATMYYINSNIFDCKKIAAGTNLCLPLTCTNLYKVKKGDTCLDIAMNANILTDRLLSFNPQIDSNCTNLYDADPYWGSTLCVSTPGGTYSGQPLNNTEPIDPEPINPPYGAPIANGTTKQCSHWFTHDGSLSCTQICLAYEIPINLFTDVNPSLNKTTCDTDLVVGNAYCLEPVAGWYQPTPTRTMTPGATVSKTATGTKSATATDSATHTSENEPSHSPEQPGIVGGCNKWHYVDNGDGCYSIAEKYKIKLTDFYS